MPYQEQSPLSAAVGFASSYLGAQSEKKRYDQEQARKDADEAWRKEQAQNEAALQAAKFKLDSDSDKRLQGIDPATGLPPAVPQNLTQIRPNNAGKGGPPSLPELIAHNNALAAQFSAYPGLAAKYTAQAHFYQTELEKQQGDAEREKLHGMPTYADTHPQGPKPTYSELHGPFPSYSDLHPRQTGPRVSTDQAATSATQFYSAWSAATRAKQPLAPGLPAPPADISPQEAKVAEGWFSRISSDPNPIATAKQFATLTQNPKLKELLYKRAEWASKEHESSGGGSQADGPFGPAPP